MIGGIIVKEAVIVAGARTPVGRAGRGTLANTRPDDLAALTVKETLKRAGNYDGNIDDVIFGNAMPEAEQGMNMANNIAGLAGLKKETPAITINRYCSSGLQSIAYGAERIMLRHSDTIIAGGAESMSLIPMGGHVIKPNSTLVEHAPEYYMGMGHTAEEVANRYKVSRQEQDAFTVESHKRAEQAIKAGKFADEIVPAEVMERFVGKNNKIEDRPNMFEVDEGVRPGTTEEILGKLRPAFNVKGSVTAGNSPQMSDGAASVLLMDREKAVSEGLTPLMKFRSFAVAGVEPEVMGIGPVEAVPKALKLAGLELYHIGLLVLTDAVAEQSVRVVRTLGLRQASRQGHARAIASGRPRVRRGSRLTAPIMRRRRRKDGRWGVVAMCIG